MKTLLFVLASTLSACAHRYSVKEAKALVRACVVQQIESCGDLICEGDETFEAIIPSTAFAIEQCFDDPDSINPEAYDSEFQQQMLRGSIYGD